MFLVNGELGQASQLPTPISACAHEDRVKVGEYDVGWCDDFGEVTGFGFPEIVEEGVFFCFFTQIFHVIDCTTPTSM